MREEIQRAERRRESEADPVGAPETERVVSSTTLVRGSRTPEVGGGAEANRSPKPSVVEAKPGPASREAMATLPDGVPAERWYRAPEDETAAETDPDATPATTPSPVLPADGRR